MNNSVYIKSDVSYSKVLIPIISKYYTSVDKKMPVCRRGHKKIDVLSAVKQVFKKQTNSNVNFISFSIRTIGS